MNRLLSVLLIIGFYFANNFAITDEPIESSNESEWIQSPTDFYMILKKLGEGAFGEVFAVENSKGEKFAIKSYKISLSDSHSKEQGSDAQESSLMNVWELLADAEREFQRGQLLDHPNIIKSVEFFTSGSSSSPTSYLVLQLVEGQTLYNTGKKSFSHQAAVHAALQLSDALRYALSFGLVHLDLHQNNIMLADGADVRVIDLASFFTFEEIYGYVSSQTGKAEAQSIKQIKANLKAPSIPPVRAKEIKRFFAQHPQLFNKLKEIGQKGGMSSHQEPFNKMAIAAGSAPYSSSNWLEAARLSFYAHYFNQITDICLGIISKSDGSREDKINKYAEIKKVAWNYLEDVEDGQSINVEESLDKLVEVLTSE